MKKINYRNVIYLLFLMIGILTFVSCNDFLDVPQNSIVTKKGFWKNGTNAKQGIAGIYDAMQAFFGPCYYLYGDQRSDNFDTYERPSASLEQINRNELTINTNCADWGNFYKAVTQANIAIQNIQNIPDFSGKDDLLGQAYALRAFLYFYGIKIWGKIPEITKPIKVNDILKGKTKPRVSVNKIFTDIIIPDIKKAEKLISNEIKPVYMSLGGVLALKAYVYMWPTPERNYSTAISAIDKLQTIGYKLVMTEGAWKSQFRPGTQNGPEIIFSLAWNFNEDGFNEGIHGLTHTNGAIQPSEFIRKKWSVALPNDFRRCISFEPKSKLANENWNTIDKYVGDKCSGDGWANLNDRDSFLTTNGINDIFYRLSGILLLKAKALNDLPKIVILISHLNWLIRLEPHEV
jgi:hypothetical protein